MKLKSIYRILIADPHGIVREGLKSALSRQEDMEVVGETDNGQEAIALFSTLSPDVLILELALPDLDGLAVIASIQKQHPDACIFVLSGHEEEEIIYEALQAGVRGYYFKAAATQSIAEAIRLVCQGHIQLADHVSIKLVSRVLSHSLTAREREVLQHMAFGNSNQEIGATLFIAEGTVKAHVNKILSKMGVPDRTTAVTQALRRGLIKLR